ncbi:MAG: phosphatidylglycerophosphatase A [Acidobacteria bacterium]|nr:phosphatidylglycerophosphatase A [Acidobacteriota bacterium]
MTEPVTPGRARWAFRLATTFGLGELAPAPGTFAGSLPAAVVWIVLALVLVRPPVLAMATAVGAVVAAAVGVWAADEEERRRDARDPGPVVIDEVAGQWLTYLVALPWVELGGRSQTMLVGLGGFLAFRIFDVLKPWPVRRLERLPGGLGIMADDLAAALYAGAALAIAAHWLL